VSLSITIDHERITEFCCRSRIRRLSFFGSVLRDDFGPASDVDVLVEFEPGATVGYFSMSRMEQELTEMFGRRVDLRTPKELSRHFRDEVLADAQEEYVA
jgi:predicted nucleotidyltransferase